MASELPNVTCELCGFDGARWSETDLRRTLARADDLIRHVIDGSSLVSDFDAAQLEVDDPRLAVHHVMHFVDGLARQRGDREAFEAMVGTVESIQRSDGGVPKIAVDEAVVDMGGVVGDGQAHRQHHGRPWQALCLFSADVIDELSAEGHPIAAGGAGENLTIRGLDWSRLRGGLTFTVGDVRCRTSVPAEPCSTIAACFADGDWLRIDPERHSGSARWYASVLAGGVIHPGDPVTVTA